MELFLQTGSCVHPVIGFSDLDLGMILIRYGYVTRKSKHMENNGQNVKSNDPNYPDLNSKTNSNYFKPNRDGANESIWQSFSSNLSGQTPELSSFGKVYDVLIIGAGITGLTTALLLQKQGMNCIVADAHNVGFGTTGGTTAHINTFADTTYADTEKAFNEKSAKLFATAISESVAIINEHVQVYNIDCDFEWKPGYVYAEDSKQAKELDSLYQSALKVGVKVNETQEVPTPLSFEKAVVFDNQAQFHPLKYITGLQKEFVALGGTVLENTRVEDVETRDEIHYAITNVKDIAARNVVYATHLPIGGINPLHFLCAPYRSYVIAVKLTDEKYPDALIYDMQEPYHYFRTHVIDGQKYLIVGGNDHKSGHGEPEKSFEDLENYVRQHYHVASVDYKWSAQFYTSADGLPYIGELPLAAKGIYAASGYNGNGMILGTISAKVMSDLILGKENVFADLFDPARVKPLAGFNEIVKENADVAYHFIADRLSVDDIKSLSEIENGSGAVVEYKDKKVAIYKDEAGSVHALNPVCTHAKCIVDWNNSEKSWDCPCHGARFDIDGNVLTGPARKNLEKIAID